MAGQEKMEAKTEVNQEKSETRVKTGEEMKSTVSSRRRWRPTKKRRRPFGKR
jgi:hypothetical protein